MQIRPANLGDLDFICGELPEFCARHNAWHLYPGHVLARKIIADTIRHHYFMVATSDAGMPLGFICALQGTHYLNPNLRTLTELLWWSKGNPTVALALLDALVEYGRRHVDYIAFSTVEAGDKALWRRGFTFGEKVWELRL